MPLPKFSLQFAFSWSVHFSNRTESYSSQIEFAGPHGIICNFAFSYLIFSKAIGRKRLRTQSLVGADLGQLVYTYKRVVCVCLLVCLLVCFLSATRHLSTLRRCLRVREQEPSRAAPRERASACTARGRANAVQLLNEKNAALMPFKNKTVRARACCRIRNCRDSQKKGKRQPTCHFPSSVYSLPSLGVFTFRIVLKRILHKSSLLAPMESRRTRRPAFTAEERLERRREQDRRRHAERRARERGEQTQARRDVDRLRSSQARASETLLQRLQS